MEHQFFIQLTSSQNVHFEYLQHAKNREKGETKQKRVWTKKPGVRSPESTQRRAVPAGNGAGGEGSTTDGRFFLDFAFLNFIYCSSPVISTAESLQTDICVSHLYEYHAIFCHLSSMFELSLKVEWLWSCSIFMLKIKLTMLCSLIKSQNRSLPTKYFDEFPEYRILLCIWTLSSLNWIRCSIDDKISSGIDFSIIFQVAYSFLCLWPGLLMYQKYNTKEEGHESLVHFRSSNRQFCKYLMHGNRKVFNMFRATTSSKHVYEALEPAGWLFLDEMSELCWQSNNVAEQLKADTGLQELLMLLQHFTTLMASWR